MLDRITADLTTALRKRDAERVRVLRTLVSQIKYEAKESGAEADDALVTRVVQRGVRGREEAMALYESGGRSDLLAAERVERDMLQAYLPAAVDDAAMQALAREVAAEVGAAGPSDMGKVMGPLMRRLRERGVVDGRRVNAFVADLLRQS